LFDILLMYNYIGWRFAQSLICSVICWAKWLFENCL